MLRFYDKRRPEPSEPSGGGRAEGGRRARASLPSSLSVSPHISPHLPTPPRISPHLPASPQVFEDAEGKTNASQQPEAPEQQQEASAAEQQQASVPEDAAAQPAKAP